MTVLAVTGGIGSGKSEVCRHLVRKGIPVYDSDSRTKQLYDSDPALTEMLSREFSLSLRLPDGSFDRAGFASVLFSGEEALRRAEAIIHPAVLEDFVRWKEDVAEAPLVAIESAIILCKPLFDGSYDCSVEVVSPLQQRLRRVALRDGAEEEDVLRRVEAQVSGERRADCTIVNDGTLDELYDKVDALVSKIITDYKLIL